ncbi:MULTISPECIES: hypothetical protein [unclassified Streptomyces]|jgi:hypothetical protein|uniref:hypothetical protein n=1 Tax=unclassified Streptomyces TaxID=2593676 RepID=UPI0034546E04
MHEMWCGADTRGEPVWHVLTTDKTSTLCGMARREEKPRGSEETDKHCFPCMKTFQEAVQATM